MTRLTDEQREAAARLYPLAMYLAAKSLPRFTATARDVATDALLYAVSKHDPSRGRSLDSWVAYIIKKAVKQKFARNVRGREIHHNAEVATAKRDYFRDPGQRHVDARDEAMTHLLRATPAQRRAMVEIMNGSPSRDEYRVAWAAVRYYRDRWGLVPDGVAV